MNEDEEIRPKKWLLLEKPVLDPLSVEDLQSYIGQLREEITRVEAAITKKHGARGHADSFFKF
jgi:uncharacterized small protein (DUF1192 family)